MTTATRNCRYMRVLLRGATASLKHFLHVMPPCYAPPMAGGVNKVILVGNLGADPDMRYTPSGQGVCELRVATSDSWTDKNGQRQERTEWHRVIVWGKRAEVCSKYLAKGRQVYVEGRLQ